MFPKRSMAYSTFILPCLSAVFLTEALISTTRFFPTSFSLAKPVPTLHRPYHSPLLFLSSKTQETQSSKFSTFREAELAGLTCMQEGSYTTAIEFFLQALKLPGSKVDVIRSKLTPGPSPVGGAVGGTEGKVVYTLDEFEYQAAYYNMACAYSQLQQKEEALASLEKAFQYGFDNFKTTIVDPDLKFIQEQEQFHELLNKYDPKRTRNMQEKGKKGMLNPFGLWNN